MAQNFLKAIHSKTNLSKIFMHLTVMIMCMSLQSLVWGSPTAEINPKQNDDSKFLVITEDIIPDIENTTQKVIRVNPLDLPSVKDTSADAVDSSLFKIKSLLPAHRNYINSNTMRRKKPSSLAFKKDSPIIKGLPTEIKFQKPKHSQKKKKLNFLYNQNDIDGNIISKSMNVHFAPGAYPIYYAVAKTNGKFGKFPLKSFHSAGAFRKYLLKMKQEPIPFSDRYES